MAGSRVNDGKCRSQMPTGQDAVSVNQ